MVDHITQIYKSDELESRLEVKILSLTAGLVVDGHKLSTGGPEPVRFEVGRLHPRTFRVDSHKMRPVMFDEVVHSLAHHPDACVLR